MSASFDRLRMCTLLSRKTDLSRSDRSDMTRSLTSCISIMLFALLAPLMASSTVHFAVAPGIITGSDSQAAWLGTGLSFDLEKRLGRWPALKNTDRMAVSRALNGVAADDQAKAAALLGKLAVDVAVTVSGSCSKERLNVTAKLWTGPKTAARVIALDGQPNDLFILQDGLVDQVVAYLCKHLPALPAPDSPARLHIRPAGSVESYGLVMQGMSALHENDMATARTLLERVLRMDAKCWWGHYFLGAVEFHEGHFAKAAEQCRAAIAIDPELYAGVYANLSYCYSGLGDTQQAEQAKLEFERRAGKPLPNRAIPKGREITETRKDGKEEGKGD